MPIKMKILPDRAAWLEHRKKYIGGSDASCIVGMNPYKDNVTLWAEKCGFAEAPDISDNPNVKFGTEAEPLIRGIFRLSYPQYEVFYEENNSFTNSECPWAAASLDGWLVEKETGRRGIWECKTSEIVSSMHKEKWNNRIPDNYFCQILHYFMVRDDCEFAHLTALLTFKFEAKEVYQQIRNYHIERADVLYDIEYLRYQEMKFARSVETKTRPALVLPGI